MHTTTKAIIAATIPAAVLSFGANLNPAANADTTVVPGGLSFDGWYQIDEGQTGANVSATNDGAHGVTIKKWYGSDGAMHKWSEYQGDGTTYSSILEYRLTPAGWVTDHRKFLSVNGEAYPFAYNTAAALNRR